ncbi:hypothetical protein [Bacillus sp. E214]|uniref:hypothetical protein n=1 Tax=Bacillus sp. E214 TaxID=2587156 RepID=UPI0011DF5F4C|nr:hypothetical protein [Bacillus sp. E214]
MKSAILELFDRYTSNINVRRFKEDFESYMVSLKLENIVSEFNWGHLSSILEFVNSRDTLSLRIKVDDGEPYSYQLVDPDEAPANWFNNLCKNIDDESIVEIEYEITKKRVNSYLSIYDLDLFIEFMKKQKLMHILNYLEKNIEYSTTNIFELQNTNEPQVYFRSHLIVFSASATIIEDEELITQNDRSKLLKRRELNSNSMGFSKVKFIPEDFKHSEDNSAETFGLLPFFDTLKVILASTFISNISNVTAENNGIKLSFVGHKYLEVETDYDGLNNFEATTFYDIYRWIYRDDEIHDKLDLARNIITRYFISTSKKWSLPQETLSSIQSAHAIYLKENVEKYIETKNKVAEITTELSVKSRDIAQYFISNFKSNNLTLLSFFISIFVLNSLSDDFGKEIFNKEISYFSLAVLLVSTVYLVFTRKQLYKEQKSNIRYFYSMKRIYRDIFDREELNNLFHKRQFKYNLKLVNQTANLFTFLWFIEIIVLLAIVIVFGFFDPFK